MKKLITLIFILSSLILKSQTIDEIFNSDFRTRLNSTLIILYSEEVDNNIIKIYKGYDNKVFDINLKNVYYAYNDTNLFSINFELNIMNFEKFSSYMKSIVKYEVDDYNNISYNFNSINILCKPETKYYSIVINHIDYLKLINYDSFDMINIFYSVK